MDRVFVYWDNSNIFISAQQVAVEREGADARYRVRIDFRNMLALAHAGRRIQHAVAVGSIPPELRHVWNRLEGEGVSVHLLERGTMHGGEQGVDQTLSNAMLRDGYDYNGDPGIAVLLTGDGAGFHDGVSFHADLERMHSRGWDIEVISWRHSCNTRMRQWAGAKRSVHRAGRLLRERDLPGAACAGSTDWRSPVSGSRRSEQAYVTPAGAARVADGPSCLSRPDCPFGGSSLPGLVKPSIRASLGDQPPVGAVLDHPARIEHEDPVGNFGRGQPVGDGDHGASGGKFAQCPGDTHLGGRVHRGGGLVQNQQVGIGNRRPHQGDQLTLADREGRSPLSHLRVESLSQLSQPAVQSELNEGLLNLGHGGVGFAHPGRCRGSSRGTACHPGAP